MYFVTQQHVKKFVGVGLPERLTVKRVTVGIPLRSDALVNFGCVSLDATKNS